MEKRLNNVQIKAAPDGKLFDGAGLALIKSGSRGKWVYRYSHLGKRREMGLGTWPSVSLQAARAARAEWAAVLASGLDPIRERKAREIRQREERDRSDPSFADAVQMFFERKQATLRGGGERGRWMSPLQSHVLPVIGKTPLSLLTQHDIHRAIVPIWRKKHPTATKALQRTRIVLRDCALMGFPVDPVIADRAKIMLGEVLHQAQCIPATPWQEIPALYARLDRHSAVDQCLRWMILTLVRFSGCSGARQSEIEGPIWTVPADRLKGREGKVRPFRVPLTEPALEIARACAPFHPELLFPGTTGRPITSRAVEVRLNSLGEVGRPHGFRTSFRTWVQDTDACSFEVAETILGHSIGSIVERSYARSDLLDRRAKVMDAWASYVIGEEVTKNFPQQGSNLLQ